MGAFPFERPLNPEFHATFKLHNRWEMFDVLNLEVNHRQVKDKPYAETLNRIRIGKMNAEDIAQLKTRVRQNNHPDFKKVSLCVVPTRIECAPFNNKYACNSEKVHTFH